MKLFFAFLLASLPALAQTVHWDPPGGQLAVGETSNLQLVFEDCQPKATPSIPPVAGLTLDFAGQSSNVSIINGSYSQTVSLNYGALLSRKQAVEIPAFDVETNKGRVHVAAARFDPTGATVGGGQSLDSAAHSALRADPTQVWAGQVFNLDYTVEAARSYYPDFGRGAFDWNAEPLVAEDWSRPEPFDTRANGEAQTGLRYRTRALAHKPGSYRLNPVNQALNLSVGVSAFGFFQQRNYQQFSVASDVPTIDVRPLPAAPAGFSGAVGHFKLVSKVVPEKAAVGEPITWTLELTGTGNWPDIAGLPPREVSKDFQVVAPKARRTPSDNKLFDSKLTEDVVLMPTKSGDYSLRPVQFVYFDPDSGMYKTLATPRVEVTVTPVAGVASSAAAAAPAAETAAAAAPAAPAAPEGLPRDPIPDAGDAARPLAAGEMAVWIVLPAAALVALWLALATLRARASDPARMRREARLRLAATLEKLGSLPDGPGPEVAATLLSWQRDAAVLWGMPQAAPTSPAVSDPAWASLWADADRAIFGAEAALPADWVARARAALAGTRAPGFVWRLAFRRHNFLPFLAIVLAAAGFAAARGESSPAPASAYRRGDFAGAESGWRRELSSRPDAWALHYDLSLALAQQDRWDEAAAHAAVAFVQHPDSDSVRWQFDLACAKAGFVPGPLADFLSPSPRTWFARMASPAVWQRLLIAAAWLAAAALALLLLRAYGSADFRFVRTVACSAAGLALLVILGSWIGAAAYGAAADREAGMVWRNTTLRSIPTEADAAQKTTPLGAGNLARKDRSFLGWLRLNFDNGQTGWIRSEEVVWLWK